MDDKKESVLLTNFDNGDDKEVEFWWIKKRKNNCWRLKIFRCNVQLKKIREKHCSKEKDICPRISYNIENTLFNITKESFFPSKVRFEEL